MVDDMTATFLETKGLSVLRGSKHVIHGLDLEVRPGEWFGLLGANGSGKTSLLRAISGRLAVAGGSCLIAGVELQASRFKRAKAIEFAPTPDTLPKSLSAREIFNLIDDCWEANLGELFGVLDLESFLDRPTGSYSAGMRQRTAIACAFVRGKSTVILDEPFNWLDPVAVFDLKIALGKWVTPTRCLITALHDTSTLVSSCDRGVLLARGEVKMVLDPRMLSKARSNIAAFEKEMIGRLRE